MFSQVPLFDTTQNFNLSKSIVILDAHDASFCLILPWRTESHGHDFWHK